MRLDGKVALVTGTSPNIGGGIAEGLRPKARRSSASIHERKRCRLRRYIKSTGGRASA